MNDIIKDYLSEKFTLREWLKYGVLYPIVMIGLCLLSSLY